MIDKLGSVAQVLLRLQAKAGGATGAARPGGAAAPAPALTLQQRALQRLAGVDREDPRRRHKALRAFIEVRLLAEFGDALVNDPEFQHVVDEVVRTMEASPALQPDIGVAVDQLLAQAAP